MRTARNHFIGTSAVFLLLLAAGGFSQVIARKGAGPASPELDRQQRIEAEAVVDDGTYSAHAQKRTFTADDIEYTLELPSPEWRAVSRLDVHHHVEFIYGKDVANGYLQIRKILSAREISAEELFARDESLEFQKLAGYVVCSDCKGIDFQGNLRGAVFSYEYVAGGRPMYGRVYYLQVDKWTFYSLRFTASRDNLPLLRDQMDLIAKSFQIKHQRPE